jgi:hypothetical protein
LYKLVVNSEDGEEVLEFATSKLALLYRDYHLTFGSWKPLSVWIEDASLEIERHPFIVAEKVVTVNEVPTRFYRVVEGIDKVKQESAPESLPATWVRFRAERTALLACTDWTQVADSALEMHARKDYRSYRAYLRALPSLHNEETIVTAKVYSFEDWKKGNR